MSHIELANIKFKGLKQELLFSDNFEGLKHITTINAEFIVLANNNKRFLQIINNSIATIDGQWPYIVARIKHSSRKFEKISGSDLIYHIFKHAKENNLSLFLLGDTEDVNAGAVRMIRQKYQINVAGYSPPFQSYPFDCEVNNEIVRRIKIAQPDYLLVGFGAPKQEFWIDDHKDILTNLKIKYAIGLGGTFRFISGKESRAPRFISHLGLESFWRLFQNPYRFKRFLRSFRFFKYL